MKSDQWRDLQQRSAGCTASEASHSRANHNTPCTACTVLVRYSRGGSRNASNAAFRYSYRNKFLGFRVLGFRIRYLRVEVPRVSLAGDVILRQAPRKPSC
eukprot:359060-Chlamydomonas_euryale.AAC.3